MTILQKQFKTLQNQITNEMTEKFPLHKNLTGDQKLGLKVTIMSFINQGVSTAVTVIPTEDLSLSNLNKAESSSSALASCHLNEQSHLIIKEEVDMDNFGGNPFRAELCEADDYNISEDDDPLRQDKGEEPSDTCCINLDIKEEWLQTQFYHSEKEQEFNSEVSSRDNLAADSKETNADEDVSTSRALVAHKRSHTVERSYKCEACGKEFTTLNSLKRQRKTHIGEKADKCNYCEKCYAARSFLKIHERIRTEEIPFKCETCGKSFSAAMNLMKHKKIHTGEKPYKCDTCEKAFTAAHSLAYHKNLHTGEKPYQCNTCGQAFYDPSCLSRHKDKHNGRKS